MGKFGHKGHNLSKERALKLIDSGKAKHVVIEHYEEETGGEKTDSYESRYIIELETNVVVEEHRFYKSKKGAIPEEYKTEVQYGDSLKTFVAMQANEGFVSINRLKNMLSEMTEGMINMSGGTIVNITQNISKNLGGTVIKIRNALIKSEVLYVDEAGARVNGELKWIHTSNNELYSYYYLADKRGTSGMAELGILEYFVGILVHDHWESYYKYKVMTHAECNAHILRYLKYVIELFQREGAKEFLEFLIAINNEKEEYIKNNPTANSFNNERHQEIEQEYDELLGKWEGEHKEYIKGKKINKSLREESNLFKRLQKYKENHLMFITNFKVQFSNNLAERSLRMLKTKLKVSGCFRGKDNGNDFLTVRSFIETCKKHGMNIYDAMKKIINKEEIDFKKV